MLNPSYPNLELVEYKVRQLLMKDTSFTDAIKKARELNRFAIPRFEATMFYQMWPNTCTGFDITKDGSPAIGGQAFTAAYTVVLHEMITDSYIVCFGNEPCYCVTHATDAFYEDLRNHNMAPLSKAAKRY